MSQYVYWNPGIVLGIKEIDLEHQTFVIMINQLDDYQNQPAMASRIIQALVRYAAFHFQSEENIMFAVNYPALEAHRSSHLDLLDHLNIVLLELRTGETQNYQQILEFFKDWYVNHTTKIDMRFAEFLNQQEVSRQKIVALSTLQIPFSLPSTLDPSHLSRVPTPLLERLEAAIRSGQQVIATIIQEIRQTDTDAAAQLLKMADMDYSTIANVVRATLNTRQRSV
jgi:hemerythrin-like metal-binding protein